MNAAAKKRLVLLLLLVLPLGLYFHQLSGTQLGNVESEAGFVESHQRVLLNVDSYNYEAETNQNTSQSSRVIVASISTNTPQIGDPYSSKKRDTNPSANAPPTSILQSLAVSPITKGAALSAVLKQHEKASTSKSGTANASTNNSPSRNSANTGCQSKEVPKEATSKSSVHVQTTPPSNKIILTTTKTEQDNGYEEKNVQLKPPERQTEMSNPQSNSNQPPPEMPIPHSSSNQQPPEASIPPSSSNQQPPKVLQADKFSTPVTAPQQSETNDTVLQKQPDSQLQQKIQSDIMSGKQTTLEQKLTSKQHTATDYFQDWPSATCKGGCPDARQYKIKDKFISVAIYMTDDLDSLPVQTFLSIRQFSAESGYTIDRVVLAYTNTSNISTLSHVAHIEYITNLTADSVQVHSVSAETEWQAKKKSLEILKSNQVVVLDDTVVVNRDYLSPLLAELQEKPRSLIYPHTDSLVPWGIYQNKKKNFMEQVVWEEQYSNLYRVTNDWQLSKINTAHVVEDGTPVSNMSAGLTGQVIVARRDHLLYLLSQMKTDDVVELSILSWLCGDGVVAVKCSAVVRVNYTYLSLPTTHNKQALSAIYSEKTTSNITTDASTSQCKQGGWYFTKLPDLIPWMSTSTQ